MFLDHKLQYFLLLLCDFHLHLKEKIGLDLVEVVSVSPFIFQSISRKVRVNLEAWDLVGIELGPKHAKCLLSMLVDKVNLVFNFLPLTLSGSSIKNFESCLFS